MFTNLSRETNHHHYMRLALMQAKKNLGNTKENPSVGCVIVKKNSVISSGYTSINGRPHAEKNAISYLKKNISNCTIYVTLEPCSNYGKTPPCVNLISKKNFKEIFISINDPDLRSFKKSIKKLKKKGIYTRIGILEKKVKKFYSSYIIYKNKTLPFVTCKLAVSKDFYTINKKYKWITNEQSRGRVHLMRSSHDCLITSSKTVNIDNPSLTCRINGLLKTSPSRIILDKNLRINIKSKVLIEASKYKTIVFYSKYNKKKIKLLNKLKVKTYKIRTTSNGQLDLEETLIKAKKLGYSRIFLESGINLIKSFLSKNLVNEFKLFISKSNLGKNGGSLIKKDLNIFLKNKNKRNELVNLNGDQFISYEIK